jgi:hypothetical protein
MKIAHAENHVDKEGEEGEVVTHQGEGTVSFDT